MSVIPQVEMISKAKQNAYELEQILRNNPAYENIELANKLHTCCPSLYVKTKNNGPPSVVPYRLCGVPFCPICLYFKARRECAKFAKIHQRILADPVLKNPKFAALTLTTREAKVGALREEITRIKDAFDRLIQQDTWKKTVIASSRFLHIELNPSGYIKPHWHVLLVVKSSFYGKLYINDDQWANLWQEALACDYHPQVHCQSLGKRGIATSKDITSFVSYGLNTIDFSKYIRAYPNTFLEFMPLWMPMRRIRKASHDGIIKSLRSELKEAYKIQLQANKLLPAIPTQVATFLFNGKQYYQNDSRIVMS